MSMVHDGIHRVRRVNRSQHHPDKDDIILDAASFPFFRTNHGELKAGDRVRVEDGSYAGKVEQRQPAE